MSADQPTDLGMGLEPMHFPGRPPIDSYGNGGFRFDGLSHRGSLMILPSGIYAWNIERVEQFSVENFTTLFKEASEIEVLLLGTGHDIVRLSASLMDAFRDHVIIADSMNTGAAVRTYNIMLAENRAVAVAMLAV